MWLPGYGIIKVQGKTERARGITLEAPDRSPKHVNASHKL